MPLPFGTPCYFGNVRGNLIYCSVLSSGWQESPQGNTKMGIRGEGVGWGGCWEKEPCPLYILLDEFVKQIHDVSLKTSCGMAPFSDALISEWLLSSHEIPWNQFLHLWPLNAGRYSCVTTEKYNQMWKSQNRAIHNAILTIPYNTKICLISTLGWQILKNLKQGPGKTRHLFICLHAQFWILGLANRSSTCCGKSYVLS